MIGFLSGQQEFQFDSPVAVAEPHAMRCRYSSNRRRTMTDPNNIADREAGPLLEPGERPMSEGKRWAILLGFAAAVFLAAFSIDHTADQGSAPPAAATATQPAPPSTSAVAPQPAPAAPSRGG
jgi:hypothetical protein